MMTLRGVRSREQMLRISKIMGRCCPDVLADYVSWSVSDLRKMTEELDDPYSAKS
jgi:hypothetical protein